MLHDSRRKGTTKKVPAMKKWAVESFMSVETPQKCKSFKQHFTLPLQAMDVSKKKREIQEVIFLTIGSSGALDVVNSFHLSHVE